MDERKELSTLDDIKLLVNTFYENVRKNELLAPIFNSIINDRWPQHLEKMYRFWQTVLLDEHTYGGSPFPPHAKMPISHKHFDAWLRLWHETIDTYFTGAKAEEAKWRGDRMAQMFLYKIEYFRGNHGRSLD